MLSAELLVDACSQSARTVTSGQQPRQLVVGDGLQRTIGFLARGPVGLLSLALAACHGHQHGCSSVADRVGRDCARAAEVDPGNSSGRRPRIHRRVLERRPCVVGLQQRSECNRRHPNGRQPRSRHGCGNRQHQHRGTGIGVASPTSSDGAFSYARRCRHREHRARSRRATCCPRLVADHHRGARAGRCQSPAQAR